MKFTYMLFRRCPATIQYAPLSWQNSFSPTAFDQRSAFLTWKVNGSNFDGLLLMSGDTHNDENLIGYGVFAPLSIDMNDFIEIYLKFEKEN